MHTNKKTAKHNIAANVRHDDPVRLLVTCLGKIRSIVNALFTSLSEFFLVLSRVAASKVLMSEFMRSKNTLVSTDSERLVILIVRISTSSEGSVLGALVGALSFLSNRRLCFTIGIRMVSRADNSLAFQMRLICLSSETCQIFARLLSKKLQQAVRVIFAIHLGPTFRLYITSKITQIHITLRL